MSRFKCHYLLHDRGDTANGMVEDIEGIVVQLASKSSNIEPLFKRPPLPYGFNEEGSTADSYRWLRTYFLPELIPNSVVIGFGIGGLLAAKLQEDFPNNKVSVVTINSPLMDGMVKLSGTLVQNRVAIYSTSYPPIKDLSLQWPTMASQAYDVPWLQHGSYLSKYALCHLIASYMQSEDLSAEFESFKPQSMSVGI